MHTGRVETNNVREPRNLLLGCSAAISEPIIYSKPRLKVLL